ncbi:VanW family protein, partial [Jiangella rhizosphaerae]
GAAPAEPGDGQVPADAAGRASRRQQQRSFGQATAAALLDSPKRGGNGGSGDGGGDGGSDEGTNSGGRSKAKVAALVVAGVVVVLGIGYGVAYAVAGGSLARGATVAGIEVGGMTRDEARATLEEQLPALVDQPFHLTIGDEETSFEIVPSTAGLTVDVPATIDEIPGGSANPVSLFEALLGGGETTPVPSVDRAALEATLTEIAAQADIEPVNGAVAFDGGEVVTSEPQTGRAVNVDATIERLEGAFFGAESRLPIGDVQLAIDEVQPAVSAEEVQRAVAEFAEPAMSAPVTVVAGEESVELPPELVGQALTMAPDDAGTLQPALDGAKLTEVARDLLAEVGQEGRDATITIEGGEPVVVPAERGMGIAPETLSAALLPVLTAEGDARQAAVELTEVDPELTTAAAEELGVTEVVAEFTTRFPHAEYRNVNIGTAAERIDNTLLLPGEEFSLNGIVGERTEANGFTAGTIINGGRLEESLGGGVSQVATTTFHAAFLAGLEDVEHWPHSIYFDRYPVGQEATVAWGAKDMRFANDTPYGVVVDTSFTPSTPGNQGTLNVKIWSTEYYRVETSVSERSNFTSPQTIYDTSDNCQAQGGSQGFDITSYRQVWDPEGTLVKDEADPWTYNPNHRVICGPDPGEDEGNGNEGGEGDN